MALVLIWSAVENHLAIVIACVPAMKATLLHYFPSLKAFYHSVRSRSTKPSDPNDSEESRLSTATTLRSPSMSEKFVEFFKGRRDSAAEQTESSELSTITVTRNVDLESSYVRSRENSTTSVETFEHAYGSMSKGALSNVVEVSGV